MAMLGMSLARMSLITPYTSLRAMRSRGYWPISFPQLTLVGLQELHPRLDSTLQKPAIVRQTHYARLLLELQDL